MKTISGNSNSIQLLFMVALTTILTLSSCFGSQNKDNSIKTKMPPTTVLSLQPGPDNPRNSEGDFINLNDGRILFV